MVLLKKKQRVQVDGTASSLLVVGGLNWGAEALGSNIVEALLPSVIVPFIYGAVGLSAVWVVFRVFWKGFMK